MVKNGADRTRKGRCVRCAGWGRCAPERQVRCQPPVSFPQKVPLSSAVFPDHDLQKLEVPSIPESGFRRFRIPVDSGKNVLQRF